MQQRNLLSVRSTPLDVPDVGSEDAGKDLTFIARFDQSLRQGGVTPPRKFVPAGFGGPPPGAGALPPEIEMVGNDLLRII